jgi:hypothetical protein
MTAVAVGAEPKTASEWASVAFQRQQSEGIKVNIKIPSQKEILGISYQKLLSI